MARPSMFTQELADEICRRIEAGETLLGICKDKHMPNQNTVHEWKRSDAGFGENYARARVAQADAFADEIVEVAKDSSLPAEDRRVQVDALKWTAARRNPGIYGDKLGVNHTGEVNHKVMPDERIYARLDELDRALAAFGTVGIEGSLVGPPQAPQIAHDVSGDGAAEA